MTTITPIKDFVFTFPTDKDGKDIRYVFMLTLSKRLANVNQPLQQLLSGIQGIDRMDTRGIYTLEIAIAHTFDPEQIIAAIQDGLKTVLSDIAIPQKTLIT